VNSTKSIGMNGKQFEFGQVLATWAVRREIADIAMRLRIPARKHLD